MGGRKWIGRVKMCRMRGKCLVDVKSGRKKSVDNEIERGYCMVDQEMGPMM